MIRSRGTRLYKPSYARSPAASGDLGCFGVLRDRRFIPHRLYSWSSSLSSGKKFHNYSSLTMVTFPNSISIISGAVARLLMSLTSVKKTDVGLSRFLARRRI